MNKKNKEGDLFILGAGSSYPYGLPLGSELLQLIKNFESYINEYFSLPAENTAEYLEVYGSRRSFGAFKVNAWNIQGFSHKNINKIFKKINKHSYYLMDALVRVENFSKNDLISFFELLNESGVISIDTFVSNLNFENGIGIDRVNKFKMLGKVLIGFHINCLFDNKGQSNWIEYYMHEKIAYRSREFINDPPAVISFNYDTLFESKIKNFLKLPGGEKNNFNLNPIHVYGKIEKQLIRSIEDMSDAINYWSTTIETIQRDETPSSVKQIRELISSAKRIFILGYGFDRFNNRVLFKDDNSLKQLIQSDVEIFVTGIGVQDALLNKLNTLGIKDEFIHFNDKEVEQERIHNKAKKSIFKKIMYKNTDSYDLISKHGFKLELFPEE